MNWIKNTLSTINTNSLSAKKQKQFGYLLLVILTLFLGILIYKNGLTFNSKQNIVLVLIITFSITAFFFSKLLYPLLIVWFFIGEVLGKVTSFSILAIVYFIIFTPITTLLSSRGKAKRYPAKWIDRIDSINYEELS